MYVILLALGLVGAIAGAGLIALNPPVDAIRLAHTLLILGAIALTGGAILIGVAAANRQLRRIAQLLDSRPQPRAAGVPAASETPQELAPLVQMPPSPSTESTGSSSGPPLTASAPPAQPDTPFHPTVLDPAVVEAPAPPPVPPKPESSAFDAMWARASRNAQEKRQVQDPALDEPHAEGTAPPPKSASGERETVTVFKSGVIDGMAYTLYTDGSIEAEMPGGTVRFATVDDLRTYLDESA
jgi:hypothetical protein